jgi:ankyrin repeat protein
LLSDFVKKLVDERPERANSLAREQDHKNETPMHLAAHYNRDEILKVMLNHDRSLGYTISEEKGPLLYTAAHRGHVTFARALLEHCPDAPYCNNVGRTCLHEAVEKDRIKFVEFILEKNSKLGKLVNMLDGNGDSALHMAVRKCDPKMVRALLGHPDIDVSVINNGACTAIWTLNEFKDLSKTINWVRMLSTNL